MDKVIIEARHKTEYESYRRCGLVFSKRWEVFEVSPEDLETLTDDLWLEWREPSESAPTEDSQTETPEEKTLETPEAGAETSGNSGVPAGWTVDKLGGTWWLITAPSGVEHKVNGGKTAAEAYERLLNHDSNS